MKNHQASDDDDTYKSSLCRVKSKNKNQLFVVSIDSTLGYEAFGRGNKTAIFGCRDDFLNTSDLKFGWPADLPNNGPFWTNDQDEMQFQRVMDYLNINHYIS